jgi:phage terminase large subunit GpA-like protein
MLDIVCPHCGSYIQPVIHSTMNDSGEECFEEECPVCEESLTEN